MNRQRTEASAQVSSKQFFQEWNEILTDEYSDMQNQYSNTDFIIHSHACYKLFFVKSSQDSFYFCAHSCCLVAETSDLSASQSNFTTLFNLLNVLNDFDSFTNFI